ncbi:hypothetical protein Q7I67_22705, partial [Escherichia coli]|uniref:hypothetical protein n=1 Tax=Escherichia coli TaxID=562 RepID=UPI003EE6F088
VAMLSPIDCITTSFFQKPGSFQISDKTPSGIFFERVLRTGSRPRRQIYVDYFYPSDENPTFNPSCSAAECPQHSLAEAERIFPKGFRREPY